MREYKRRESARIRQIVLEHYGGICACCGEPQSEFLAIDHIEGGGAQHKKTFKGPLTRWLYKNGLPDGFRVLCHNCNQSMGVARTPMCRSLPHPW